MALHKLFYPVLDALANGRVIRRAVALALQLFAALVLLGGAYTLFMAVKFSFQSHSATFTIGGLLLSLVVAAAVLCVAQILFYRSEKVSALPESSFTVIPIVSILFRLAGEVYATLGVAVGVGGCLFIWLAQQNPLALLGGLGAFLPSAPGGDSFVGGVLFLLYMLASSFFGLLSFYFLAELALWLTDIRRQAHIIAANTAARPASPAPAR